MDSTYIVWYLGLLGGTLAFLIGTAITAPHRYEAVASPLVFKAGVIIMATSGAWLLGLRVALGLLKPIVVDVVAAETRLSAFFIWGGLFLVEGFLLIILFPLMEMLASKCARHND